MPPGCPRPNSLLILLTLAILPGCSMFPIPRGASGPATPTPGATIDRPPSALPIPARFETPAPVETALPLLPRDELPPPTPLLDNALVKAKTTQLLVLDEVAIAGTPLVAETDSATLPIEESPKVVEPPKPAPTAAELWVDSLEVLRGLARQRPSEVPAATWSARAMFLDCVARIGADPEVDRLNSTLIAAIPVESTDPASRSDRIREAVNALEDRAPLEVTDVQLCRKVHGFGDFESLSLDAIKPGQPVILYWEVTGLRQETVETGFRTRLAAQVEIVPQSGGVPVLSQTLSPVEDRCRKRRRDYYVNSRVDLPGNLGPGTYELRLTQTDTIANRSSSRVLVFSVKP